MELLSKVLLTKNQKFLIKFQRQNLIHLSDSESAKEDDQDGNFMIDLENKKESALKQLQESIDQTKTRDLSEIDKKLLFGLHEKNVQDIEEKDTNI